MMRAFIIRHGDTFLAGETPRRIGAPTDLPLVDHGREQADRLRGHFHERSVTFRRVLSGRLRRSRETAQRVLPDILGDEIETVWWLDEIDHGPDENRSEQQVEARIGKAALALWDRQAVAPTGWIVDADRRSAAWHDFFASAPDGDILLVTSNGAARFALQLCGSAIERRSLKLATGAFGVIERDREGRLRVVDWNVRP